MISSGAFPKLAFRNPPTPGPVCSDACSVASPISQASGTSEAAASTKRTVSFPWKTKRMTRVAGASARDVQRSFRATRLAYAGGARGSPLRLGRHADGVPLGRAVRLGGPPGGARGPRARRPAAPRAGDRALPRALLPALLGARLGRGDRIPGDGSR